MANKHKYLFRESFHVPICAGIDLLKRKIDRSMFDSFEYQELIVRGVEDSNVSKERCTY